MLFIHDLRASGVVRNALAIGRKAAEKHDVLLVARHNDGFLVSEARAEPRWRVQTLFPGAASSHASAVLRLRRLIRREKPDVLLSAGNRGHWVVWPATRGLRRPLRLYRISNSIDRSGRGKAGLRGIGASLLARDADRLFLVGRATGASPQFSAALDAGRATIITNGVDVGRARQLAQAPSPSDWLSGPEPLIISVGRLAPQKDFPTLVRATALASRTRPYRLVIVGKGSIAAQRELEDLARAEGLANRFLLAGETDNVFAWLARADLFVLPSRWEGSPMALLEALAVGLPVVTTWQAGDAPHILDDGRFGLLVQAGDVASMAAAILRQTSPDAVLPGERACTFSADATVARYAAGIDCAVAHAYRDTM